MKIHSRGAARNRILAVALLAAAAPGLFGSIIAVDFYDQRFGMVNDATGSYTQVSNLPITFAAAGMAALNGLFYVEDFGNNLFTVDPVTGAATMVGSTGMNLDPSAFAATSTGLFEIDQSSNLYSISAATGVATLIGATGIAPTNRQDDTSLSSDGTWLYYTAGLGGQPDELYRINVLTGIATDLGSTGVRSVAGSAFVDGELELFQYGQSANYIYMAPDGSTDFTRGVELASAAQIIDGGAVFEDSVTNSDFDGPAVPEPATLGLAVMALLAATGLQAVHASGRFIARQQPKGVGAVDG